MNYDILVDCLQKFKEALVPAWPSSKDWLGDLPIWLMSQTQSFWKQKAHITLIHSHLVLRLLQYFKMESLNDSEIETEVAQFTSAKK